MGRLVRGLTTQASRSFLPRARGAFGVSLAAAFAMSWCAGNAGAYCRTTTTKLPNASFDPSAPTANGMCWTSGTPLAWPRGSQVAFSLAAAASSQVTLADATRVADAAFATWNDAICPTSDGAVPTGEAGLADSPDVQAFDSGPADATLVATDCGLAQCRDTVHDAHHLIVFRDSNWTHSDANNTLALTTVTYGADSGTIYDADIEINSSTTAGPAGPPHLLTTIEPPPANLPPNTYDLQAILTHEAGHFLGLAHATQASSLMYAYYQPGSLTLTQDDLAGICTIYPPGEGAPGRSSGGCSLEPGPAFPFAPAFAAVAFALFACARRNKKTRAGSAA